MATTTELRQWCFGTAVPEESGTLLPDAPIFRVMAYRFAPERYPEFRDDYRRAAMSELPLAVELERIARAFREAGVRFAPIKGADLAKNCYPDPVLRTRCDIDLLVRREDLELALDIARAGGWHAAHEYRSDKHCPSMYKKNAMLELHFNLPGFSELQTAAAWEKFAARDGSTEFRLPRELSLIVAFHHSRGHRWINSPVLIADGIFLLKAGADWKLVREYAAEFGAADPALLCFALPELFPTELMPPGPPPDEELRLALREALLHPVNFDRDRGADVMKRGDRFGGRWWRDRLRGFAPSSVRMNYGLPDDAGFGRMTSAYFRMVGDKLKLALRGMRARDGELTEALRRAETIERGLPPRRK